MAKCTGTVPYRYGRVPVTYGTVLYCMVRYGTGSIPYIGTVRYNILPYGTVPYGTVPCTIYGASVYVPYS